MDKIECEVVYVETNLYDVQTGKLIWSGINPRPYLSVEYSSVGARFILAREGQNVELNTHFW